MRGGGGGDGRLPPSPVPSARLPLTRIQGLGPLGVWPRRPSLCFRSGTLGRASVWGQGGERGCGPSWDQLPGEMQGPRAWDRRSESRVATLGRWAGRADRRMGPCSCRGGGGSASLGRGGLRPNLHADLWGRSLSCLSGRASSREGVMPQPLPPSRAGEDGPGGHSLRGLFSFQHPALGPHFPWPDPRI